MYKSQQESIVKVELVHAATEFNKSKFKSIDQVKAHLQTCKFVNNQYEVDDEDMQLNTDKVIGIQHQKICCGYGTEVRVPLCSQDHQLVYVQVTKELDPRQKGLHYKWIKKF